MLSADSAVDALLAAQLQGVDATLTRSGVVRGGGGVVSALRRSFRSYVASPAHGPLPAILLLLTISTGIIDAASILGLGRVFVANMTGNVVFVAFALAGAPGFSLWGSVIALAAFLVGAVVGGVFVGRFQRHRGELLRNALVAQAVLVLAAVVFAGAAADLIGHLGTLAATALALGLQNAVVRHLGVPDMTTTVLTMTLTGIAADLRRRDLVTIVRRITVVLAMLLGALLGTTLVLRSSIVAALVAVLLVTVVALVAAAEASRSTARWTTPGQ